MRTKSVLEKVDNIPNVNILSFEHLLDKYSQDVIKLLYNFEDILINVTEKNEPSILSRYLIELSKAFSSFYNENKIIAEEEVVRNERIILTKAVGKVLKEGANLLGINMPNKM